jgi:hypothetical protein
MFESLTEVETAISYLIIGLILSFSSVSVMIVFLCYKELRHGIYGMIIGTFASEVYLGLHLVINGASGLINTNEKHLNSFLCRFDGLTTIFFSCFWCTQNIFIMYLSYKRKLVLTRLTQISLFFSLIISLAISFISFFTTDLDTSYSDDCFIANISSKFTISIVFALFSIKFIFSILYNFWFFFYRDTSKDRSFINGYNYFLIVTSFLLEIFIFYALMLHLFGINPVAMRYISFISFFICCVYISYSRMQIEYIQILISLGPSEWRIINLFKFLGCCYTKPKFKDMKKVLNIRLIIQPNLADLDETIFHSKILKSNDM